MPYPIFILEGPDNTGKSTLAECLSKKCNAAVIHSTYRFKGKMMAYHLAQFRKALKLAQSQPVVLDRWWCSEMVYSNVYRDGGEKGYDWELLHDLAQDYWVSYTYCLPSTWTDYWSWHKKHYTKDEEMFPLDVASVWLLWKTYREWALESRRHFKNNRSNVWQMYNVTIDQHMGTSFADYIMSRAIYNLQHVATEDEKNMMKAMSENWQLVGRMSNDEIKRNWFRDATTTGGASEPSVRTSDEHVETTGKEGTELRLGGGQHEGAPEQLDLF